MEFHKLNHRAVASPSLPVGQDSTFPKSFLIFLYSFFHFFSNFLHFLPHFGLPGGRLQVFIIFCLQDLYNNFMIFHNAKKIIRKTRSLVYTQPVVAVPANRHKSAFAVLRKPDIIQSYDGLSEHNSCFWSK